jgi:hypothetical protein
VYGEVPPEAVAVKVADCSAITDVPAGAAETVSSEGGGGEDVTVSVTVFEFAVCPPESVIVQ